MDRQSRIEAPPAFVLVSYAEGEDPGEVAKRYIQSPEAADDARDFDVADILAVESTILRPVSKFSAQMTEIKSRRKRCWDDAIQHAPALRRSH